MAKKERIRTLAEWFIQFLSRRARKYAKRNKYKPAWRTFYKITIICQHFFWAGLYWSLNFKSLEVFKFDKFIFFRTLRVWWNTTKRSLKKGRSGASTGFYSTSKLHLLELSYKKTDSYSKSCFNFDLWSFRSKNKKSGRGYNPTGSEIFSWMFRKRSFHHLSVDISECIGYHTYS